MVRAMRLVLACALSSTLLLACGGSSSSTTTQEPAPAEPDPEAARRAESEQKLKAAQASAVHAMCERLVDCSVEDAKAEMSPEEVAKLNPEELVPRAQAECEAEYGQLELSPRQIKTIQRCVNEAETCPALNECLAGANKQ